MTAAQAQATAYPQITADNPYVVHAVESAHLYGLDPTLFVAQIFQESSFDPHRKNPDTNGIDGFGQFQKGTAAALANKLGISFQQLVSDPYKQLDAAALYDLENFGQFGNPEDMLRAYNGGPGAVTTSNAATRSAVDAYLAAVTKIRDEIELPVSHILLALSGQSPPKAGPQPSQPVGGIQGFVNGLGATIGSAFGSIGAGISGAMGAVTKPASAASELLNTAEALLADVMQPRWWARAGLVFVGGLMVLVGLILVGLSILGDGSATQGGKDVAETAVKVASA